MLVDCGCKSKVRKLGRGCLQGWLGIRLWGRGVRGGKGVGI